VKELFLTYQPFTWSEVLGRRQFGEIEHKIMAECAEFGMTNGFILPIYQPTGYTGLVSLAGRQPYINDDTRAALTLACLYLHNKLNTLRRREVDRRFALTEREQECLK
jgi:hypothetical protein